MVYLRRGIHGMFPLHLAALSGFSDCCRKLLSSGKLFQNLFTFYFSFFVSFLLILHNKIIDSNPAYLHLSPLPMMPPLPSTYIFTVSVVIPVKIVPLYAG